MASKTAGWIAGTAVLAALVAAGAWFVVIQPTLADAETQRQTASDQRDHNDVLKMQIAKLKAEYAHIDDYRNEIADLRTKIPTVGDLAEVTREIQTTATAAGVTISVLEPGTPAEFAPPATAAEPTPTPTPTDTASSSDAQDTSPDSSASTSTQAETGVSGMYTIPLSVTVLGTYDQTVSFLDALQQQMPRLFVIQGLNLVSQKEGGAQGGLPATHEGDLQTTVNGVLLTLVDSGSSAEPTPTPTPTLPTPSDQKNPFVPVAGA